MTRLVSADVVRAMIERISAELLPGGVAQAQRAGSLQFLEELVAQLGSTCRGLHLRVDVQEPRHLRLACGQVVDLRLDAGELVVVVHGNVLIDDIASRDQAGKAQP